MNRKEYDSVIDGQFMPFRTSNEVSLWEHCEQYINSLEQRNTELEEEKNPKIIRKGQSFFCERNGNVTFKGIDSCCGERSAILICSDGSKKYPLLGTMPQFNFIDH